MKENKQKNSFKKWEKLCNKKINVDIAIVLASLRINKFVDQNAQNYIENAWKIYSEWYFTKIVVWANWVLYSDLHAKNMCFSMSGQENSTLRTIKKNDNANWQRLKDNEE